MNISAAVLAGGKNTRIAREKSLLQIENVPLIDRLVGLLEQIFPEIIIVTAKTSLKNRFPGVITCEDVFKKAGPLAGIHAALKAASSDAVFVAACDMPNLNPLLINDMVNYYRLHYTSSELLVPRHRSGLEPLHAIYHKNNLSIIERQLQRKDYKISNFYSLTETFFYDVPERYSSVFYNINTNEDLEELKLQLS